MFSMTVPTPVPLWRRERDGLLGLGHRHVLEQGHQVHDRGARAQQRGDRVGLRPDRPDLGDARHRVVDVEELPDAARGRGVEDDGVVRGGQVLDPAADRLVDLAGEQDVAQARRDRGDEVDHAEAVERPAGQAQVVEGLEVLAQRVLGVDRQAEDAAAGRGAGEATFLVALQRRHAEELAQPLALLDLAEQHAAAAGRERAGQAGRDGRLARAALAADDVQRVAGAAHDALAAGASGRPVMVMPECVL